MKEYTLDRVIKEDCEFFEELTGNQNYMYLNECASSKESGFYQLILNGYELCYGTLAGINQVVKALCKLAERPERYNMKENIFREEATQ